jgi:hypothetical protein
MAFFRLVRFDEAHQLQAPVRDHIGCFRLTDVRNENDHRIRADCLYDQNAIVVRPPQQQSGYGLSLFDQLPNDWVMLRAAQAGDLFNDSFKAAGNVLTSSGKGTMAACYQIQKTELEAGLAGSSWSIMQTTPNATYFSIYPTAPVNVVLLDSAKGPIKYAHVDIIAQQNWQPVGIMLVLQSQAEVFGRDFYQHLKESNRTISFVVEECLEVLQEHLNEEVSVKLDVGWQFCIYEIIVSKHLLL